MNKFKTPNGFKVTGEDIDDILTNCFEGCSNYWIDGIVKVSSFPYGTTYASQVVSRGETVSIPHNAEGSEDGESEWAELDLLMMLKGIDLYIKENKFTGDSEDLVCNEDSDSILQYALFGELVYG